MKIGYIPYRLVMEDFDSPGLGYRIVYGFFNIVPVLSLIHI